MSLRTALLPILDTARGIAGRPELGLRVFSVYVTRNTYAGKWPGDGTFVAGTTVQLVNTSQDGTTQPVRVEQVSRQDIIASGGQYTDGDYKVGPMTPAYAATISGVSGGVDDTTLDPTPTATALTPKVEVVWKMTGPGLPASGAMMTKIGETATWAHYFVVLRNTGRFAP